MSLPYHCHIAYCRVIDECHIAVDEWFYLQSRDFLARIFLGVKRKPEKGKKEKPKNTDGKLYVCHQLAFEIVRVSS